MAPLTTKITTTWPTTADKSAGGQVLLPSRTQFLNRQIAQELTDGVYHAIDNLSGYGLYTTEAGATDFGNFLVDACAQVGITAPPTFVVSAV
jgi:hypothetical protein